LSESLRHARAAAAWIGLARLGLAGAACCAVACGAPSPPADLLLYGGTLVDGSGAPPRRADVAVAGGRIVAVGDLAGAAARRRIDVTGLTVTPGFVDLHSHADLILLADASTRRRLLAAKLQQGVTTTLTGNCGLGVAPATPAAAQILAQVNGWMTPDGVRPGPLDVAGYLAQLEAEALPLNVGTLVPHGPVRVSVMGLAPGAPSEGQLAEMQRLVRAGLDAGAYGLSAGLIYPPGMYSATDELVALAEVAASRDAVFSAHVRGSSETLLPATEELIEIGRRSGARVHHSHLEAVGERFWPEVRRVLRLEDDARAAGVRISHDVFPYTRAATMMAAVFPPWSLDGGLEALVRRLRDPSQRRRIREDIETQVPEWPPWSAGGWPHNLVGAVGWDGILVASVGANGPTDWVGRNLAELGAELGRDPFDVVADLMIDQRGRVGQLVDEISGRGEQVDALLEILRHPSAAVISDAEDYGRGTPHPAHAGAFPRALRLARERELMPLEAMVRKMTGHPAELYGIRERGVVRVGAAADLTVLDSDGVTDRATWEEPRRTASGIPWVIVNGTIAVEQGRLVEGSAGRVLRAAR
jgi:N-acyl-D-aspartate/D-glutamate deacylase